MNRPAILWFTIMLSVAVLLVVGWTIAGGFYDVNAKTDEAEVRTVIVKEAIAHGKQLKTTLPANDAKTVAAIAWPASEPATRYEYLESSSIIDPVSIGGGIEPDIPFTYISDIATAAKYVATMVADGWTVEGTFRTAKYVDVYLAHNGMMCRVVAMPGYMKLLYPVQSGVPDPEKFING
ncbi:hypothetical protein [Cohnella panacarvi]|uniref:hypothetical protein n=1 Tax=Cohnella panacarvi TaxID=400776 RepID=UPI00047CA9FC|nr:hypothetical protein [Cohnella panacarvi]